VYKHLLIATDGSELSHKAVRQGVALAKTLHAKVTAVTVTAPFQSLVVEPSVALESIDQYRQLVRAQSASYLEVVQQVTDDAGVACELVHVENEHPYKSIIATANERHCDLIVMASHGRHGVSALLLGSETVKVLTHCAIPVLVCR
jgi:nucleotide-binding universal stress UspA family protein